MFPHGFIIHEFMIPKSGDILCCYEINRKMILIHREMLMDFGDKVVSVLAGKVTHTLE